MKRILSKLALGLSVIVLGAVAVAPAGAHGTNPTDTFGVRCLSNGIETTMASNLKGSYYRVYLQKFLPPNWINIGYPSTGWTAADDFAGVYQNPIGMPISFSSKRNFQLSPGSYFAWAEFAYRNAQGGWSFHWVPAGKSCTIQGSVFAKGRKPVAKPRTLPKSAPKASATRAPQGYGRP
ncbi:MAG: hypothetical protein ABR583_00850 [Gaiellaceae bacterium]